MSVPVSKRNESKFQVFITLKKLRLEMTKLLLKDFGLKKNIRDVKAIPGLKNKITEEELIIIRNIAAKYGFQNAALLEEYPSWLIDHYRIEIIKILTELNKCVVCANSIYAQTLEELNERRLLQTKALCYCELLVNEFNFLIDLLPINTKKLIPYMKLIREEIVLIKGWRKSDKTLLDRVLKESRYNGYSPQKKNKIREEFVNSVDTVNHEIDEFYYNTDINHLT